MNKNEEEAHAKDIGEAISELQYVSKSLKKSSITYIETMDRRIKDSAAVYAKLDILNPKIEEKIHAFEEKKDSRFLPKETYEDFTILIRVVSEELKNRNSKSKKTSSKLSSSNV